MTYEIVCRDDSQIWTTIVRKQTDRLIELYGSDSLNQASWLNLVDTVIELLDRGYDPSVDDNALIQWVCQQRAALDGAEVDGLVERLLVDPRVDPSVENNEAIGSACEHGHLDQVRLLLADRRVDPTANQNYAIRVASMNGHLEVVELLLRYEYGEGVDPSAFCNAAITLACENGHLSVVKRLLDDYRVDPSDEGDYPFSLACANGHLEIVERCSSRSSRRS